ncbi:MAG: fumarate reductase subunit C [Planctomycetes bacterium]|nr:fumarate reductase subunit C [Planctomycetota bacterium]
MSSSIQHPPRSYRRRVSTYWWLGRWPYLKFILRELSSISVTWFVVQTLLQISALSRGPTQYMEFEAWLRRPIVLSLNAVSFFFIVFHAVTWFNLAPKAMAIRVGGKRVPSLLIAAPNYLAWLVASVAVAWIVLRG